MPTKQRRYALKTKQAKQVLEQACDKLRVECETLFDEKISVEVVESDVGLIYMVAGKAVLYCKDEEILPTLLFSEYVGKAPRIVVDMGAVPFVCKGADVMAPGIVRVEGEFTGGDLVLVVDVKHGKALAIGKSLVDSQKMRLTKKGPVVKTLHYVSDKVWDYMKTLE